MDVYSIVAGPLLWTVFIVFGAGFLIRFAFFLSSIIKSNRRNEAKRPLDTLTALGRFFLPFHKAFAKKPLYAAIRYVFHACLFVVPVWLSGHIVLWSESRFEWDWAALPEKWADWMTLIFLAIAAYFLLRRLISTKIRRDSSITDIIFIIIAALPFASGYFLTHATMDSIAFLGDNMVIFHMLSAEVMILMILFLFYRPRLNTQKCTGCAACVQNCPTETLAANDKGRLRIFNYAYFQCICCGACVNVCPEEAAELRHQISVKQLGQAFSKQELSSVELETCERCGGFFAPEPQMQKIGLTFAHDYIQFCPDCRKTNMGDRLHQISPWHKSQKQTGATLNPARNP